MEDAGTNRALLIEYISNISNIVHDVILRAREKGQTSLGEIIEDEASKTFGGDDPKL